MIDGRRKEAEAKIANDPRREKELLKLEEQAEKYRFHGQYDKAILKLGEALKMRQSAIQKLKAVNLDVSLEVSATVRLLHSFGHVFSQKGDDEKAQRAHRDAIRLYEKHRPVKTASIAK
jgi:tetratricopeptide (TPR) repeat protein